MTSSHPGAPGLPPAGWYADPAGSGQERWWSGQAWTHDLRPVPTALAPTPLAASSYDPAVVSFGGYTRPSASVGSSPATGFGTPARVDWAEQPAGSPNTTAIWILAFLPALSAVLQIVFRGTMGTGVGTSLLLYAILAAVTIPLAVWDRLELARQGLPTASPAWALLSALAYLIARRVRLKRGGVRHNAPGNVFVIVLIVSSFIAGIAYTGALRAELNAEAVAELEELVVAQLTAASDSTWRVECPDDVAADTIGTTADCVVFRSDVEIGTFTATVTAPYYFEISELR